VDYFDVMPLFAAQGIIDFLSGILMDS